MGRYRLHIVEITLENGTKEIIATNLDSEEFTIEDLRELYAQREYRNWIQKIKITNTNRKFQRIQKNNH